MPIEQFIIFFLLLLTGYFCKKYGIFNDAAINAINKFIVVIGYPCLILGRTVTLEMEHSIFINFLISLFLNVGLLLAFGAYARLYCRGKRFPDADKRVTEFAIMSPNNGFMGFPVAYTIFGSLGLLYMIGANIALNVVFFTYGIALFDRGRNVSGETVGKKFLKGLKTFAHPGIIAAFAGIVICYNRIQLPEIASGYLDLVGAVTIPVAMISIGTMLAGGFGLKSFKKSLVMDPVLNKLFVVPVITVIIIWFIPLDPLVKTIIIVSNAMPVATMVPIFSEQYGHNKSYASEMVVISTLFSMITIPVAVWILPNLGL